jgi:hypothetical protein
MLDRKDLAIHGICPCLDAIFLREISLACENSTYSRFRHEYGDRNGLSYSFVTHALSEISTTL